MCYRTKLNAVLKDIESTFKARFIEPESYISMDEINGFSFMKTPVITNDNQEEIEMLNWGLIPFWAKDDKIRQNTLNARIETVTGKPAFSNSVNNRCLIIADAYYEWQWQDPKGKAKKKYLITPKDQEIFAFAGIYASWRNPQNQELVNSYSILTTDANELMREIHNSKKRMPIILKKEDRERWLSGADVLNFAYPYSVELEARTI